MHVKCLYLELMESHFWVGEWVHPALWTSFLHSFSTFNQMCWDGKTYTSADCRSCWMAARLGHSWRWSINVPLPVAPSMGKLLLIPSLTPQIASQNSPWFFFPVYSSMLPSGLLLNSGSFPTALQRNLSENLTTQVSSRIYNQQTNPFDLKKINPTPAKTWQTLAPEQQW